LAPKALRETMAGTAAGLARIYDLRGRAKKVPKKS
jgi:hypothetical protein